MKFLVYITFFLLAGCTNIASQSVISSDLNIKVSQDDYGEYPKTYNVILKDYLINNIEDHQTTKIEFVNAPQKLTIDHLGDIYSGYRVCLSINEKKGDYYKGWRNHLFIINDKKVILHLYDSGLLTIPFEYCITRNETKTILVKDIPESLNQREKEVNESTKTRSIDDMDDIIPPVAYIQPETEYAKKNKFILCQMNDHELTFVFNESDRIFYQFEFDSKKYYEPEFSEILIAATNSDSKININRVSGLIKITSKNSKNDGKCDILDNTKF
jgi:hypothetical protein